MLPREAWRPVEVLPQEGGLMSGMTFGTPLEDSPGGGASSPELADSSKGFLTRIVMA